MDRRDITTVNGWSVIVIAALYFGWHVLVSL